MYKWLKSFTPVDAPALKPIDTSSSFVKIWRNASQMPTCMHVATVNVSDDVACKCAAKPKAIIHARTHQQQQQAIRIKKHDGMNHKILVYAGYLHACGASDGLRSGAEVDFADAAMFNH
jgi:hypothetical protein